MGITLGREFLIILGALAMGVRAGGVGLCLWGAVGLLVVGFDIAPGTSPARSCAGAGMGSPHGACK